MDSEGNIIASVNDGIAASQTSCEGTPTGNEYSDGDATSEITCTGITGNVFVASSCDNNATLNQDKTLCEASVSLCGIY